MPTIRRAALALFTLLWIAAMTAHALPDHAPTTRAASNTAGPTAPTGDFANGTVLPNGRLVTPIGTRYDLGDFPLGLAIAPAGTLAVAINSGLGYGLNPGKQSSCTSDPASAPCPYTNPPDPTLTATAGSPGQAAPDQSLSVIDLRTGRSRVITTVPTGRNPARRGMPGTYNYFYTGVLFSPDGRHLYAAGGGNDAVYDFPVIGDVVAARPARTVILPTPLLNLMGGVVPALRGTAGFTRSLAITPDGRYLLVTHEINNALAVIDTATFSEHELSFGPPILQGVYPAGVAVRPDGKMAYVALQGVHRVTEIALTGAGQARMAGTITVGDHPTALAVSPDGSQIYVANTGGDSLSIVDTISARVTQTIDLRVLPGEQAGASPDAVAVSPDGRRLYVALAGDDAVAVLAASLAGHVTLTGFLPTGWYPSAVAASLTGDHLYVASAKGLGSRPLAVTNSFQYDADNMPGLLQAIPAPTIASLAADTGAVIQNIRFAATVAAQRAPSSPIPAGPGGATPIRHVLLIVRENRTFDQVLGDLGPDEGRSPQQVDSDPAYTIFGRAVTPNAHALVGDPIPGRPDPAYAGSDNFYSDGEASIQGHYWTSSANVSDYVERTWRQYYSPRHRITDALGSISEPPGCSIFQAALHRQSATGGAFRFRDYGELTGIANPSVPISANGPPAINASPNVPEQCASVPAADISLTGGSIFTLDIDNRLSAAAFLSDVGLDADGRATGSGAGLAGFSYIVLSGDHTGGLSFHDTPRSRVAQNDAAVGMIVQSLSHSPYWSSTAIFVMEDDSQDGLDHRDGHRNLLIVISPYAKHVGTDGKPGYISHLHYSQVSVLRTIELLCGFSAMSTYDQNARPLYDLFQNKNTPAQLTSADLAPFTLQPAPSFIDETSAAYKQAHPGQAAVPAAESRTLNLSALDLAGPMLEIVNWQLARPGQKLPAPLAAEMRRWRAGLPQD
ncbi:MAG TPA: bifunctional YncE family protein/alkaline phosphatase family protein [Chloroflexota bacterium]|nr:bifunctional YncE family protein/alkaline phosphatase family protein [Chloroflexota bacterium]